jgi:hypothetical protein
MKRIACIAVALCAVLLACSEAPLGKPEDSKVDHRLDGLWVRQEKPGGQYEAWLVVPFDDRVQCAVLSTFSIVGGEPELEGAVTMRGWLTPIAGAQFISLEPIAQMLPDYEDDRGWINARLTFRDDGTLIAEMLDYDNTSLRKEKDPVVLARRVERDIGDPSLFDEPITYRRADRSNPVEKEIRKILLGEPKD